MPLPPPPPFPPRIGAQDAGAANLWILKPVGLSRGRGISVVSELADVTYADACVVQSYLRTPHLLDGYKYDLRLYVLVTSFAPLEAFIYDEGFARVSTHKFSAAVGDLSNKYIHLTNSSIQKNNASASDGNPAATARDGEAGGTKVCLEYLRRRLAATPDLRGAAGADGVAGAAGADGAAGAARARRGPARISTSARSGTASARSSSSRSSRSRTRSRTSPTRSSSSAST